MSKKNESEFRPGPEGACEAHLYQFIGYSSEDGLLEDVTRLIACSSPLEAVTYLSKREPEFRIRSFRDVGLIVLLSGSPYI